MNFTLLLDLDNTLLGNNLEQFFAEYLGAFADTVSPLIEPDVFIDQLLQSTRVMMKNRQPDCTLQEVFEKSFFQGLKLDIEDFRIAVDRFYKEVYPGLRKGTSIERNAIELVEQAEQRGYRMAVATNPLFPMTAVQQRLSWANLGTDRIKFNLVSSFETFHFAKPDPAYFAEVLARLGWPEGSILVVGDEMENDILPASRLGLATYWVTEDPYEIILENESQAVGGDIAGVFEWIDSNPPEKFTPDFSRPDSMLAILRSTPAVLDTSCRDLFPDLFAVSPKPGEWSIVEVLCHLRDVDAELNIPRLQKILSSDNPFLAGVDTDKWADERDYKYQYGWDVLQQIIATRMKMLDILEELDEREWELPALHSIFGRTNLAEIVKFIAGHDQLHVRQIQQILRIVS